MYKDCFYRILCYWNFSAIFCLLVLTPLLQLILGSAQGPPGSLPALLSLFSFPELQPSLVPELALTLACTCTGQVRIVFTSFSSVSSALPLGADNLDPWQLPARLSSVGNQLCHHRQAEFPLLSQFSDLQSDRVGRKHQLWSFKRGRILCLSKILEKDGNVKPVTAELLWVKECVSVCVNM